MTQKDSMALSAQNFIGKKEIGDFVDQYWNKSFLYTQKCFTQVTDYATRSDFFDLIEDESIESRKITYSDHYSYEEGPFVNATNEDATFFVHALNTIGDQFKQIQSVMSTIRPDWEFDDVMASVSKQGLDSGAHYDHYGVFIIQAEGQRKWELQKDIDLELDTKSSLKVLKNFKPDTTIIMNPGDVLYIPPMLGHKATSITDSLSYSVGFKSLKKSQVIKDYLIQSIENLEDEEGDFYRSSSLTKSGSELSKECYDYFFNELQKLTCNKELFQTWLAHYLSHSRYEHIFESKNNCPELNLDAKLNLLKRSDDTYVLSVNGQQMKVNKVEAQKLKTSYLQRQLVEAPSEELHHFLWISGYYI